MTKDDPEGISARLFDGDDFGRVDENPSEFQESHGVTRLALISSQRSSHQPGTLETLLHKKFIQGGGGQTSLGNCVESDIFPGVRCLTESTIIIPRNEITFLYSYFEFLK